VEELIQGKRLVSAREEHSKQVTKYLHGVGTLLRYAILTDHHQAFEMRLDEKDCPVKPEN
jgi:hypothetical protein